MEMLTTTAYLNYTVLLFVRILNMPPPSGIRTSLKILTNSMGPRIPGPS